MSEDISDPNEASVEDSRELTKERFLRELLKTVEKQEHYTILTEEKYCELLKEIREANAAAKKTTLQYRRIKRFDVIEEDGVEKIVAKRIGDKVLYYLRVDEVYDVIEKCHLEFGHCGRDKLRRETCKHYANVTITMINLYLSACGFCRDKKSKRKWQCQDVVASVSRGMSVPLAGCLVDAIDMVGRPDGNRKYIFVYTDLSTRFVQLRPLDGLAPSGVAYRLRNVFLTFGAPFVVRCRKGSPLTSETVDSVIAELRVAWPGLRLINGKYLEDPDPGSHVLEELTSWTRETGRTDWSDGLRFVQFAINRKTGGSNPSPFRATFGSDPIVGLMSVPGLCERDSLRINSEQDLVELLAKRHKHNNALNVICENSLSLKESDQNQLNS